MSLSRAFGASAFAAVAAAAAGLTVLTTAPAAASGDTKVTFEVTQAQGATVAISVPAPPNGSMGSAGPGGSISISLPRVTVDDSRSLIVQNWTASVSSTDFTHSATTNPPVISKSAASYQTGQITNTKGVAVPVSQTTTPVTLEQSRAVVVATGLVGANSSHWDPTLTIAVPATAVAGTYTGTITHSVTYGP